jgi:hypothetical protein
MASFRTGDRVKVSQQSSSRFHGCEGTVVRTDVRGLAVTYEVSFDQSHGFISGENRFFEYDLEPAGRVLAR